MQVAPLATVIGIYLAIGCSGPVPDAATRDPHSDSESLLPVLSFVGSTMLVPRRGEIIGRVSDLAVDDSILLVADGVEANVKLFTREGRHVRTFGRRGDGPGEFREPAAVLLLAGHNSFAVLDRQRGRVAVWSLDGQELRSWPHRMLLASSMAQGDRADNLALFGASMIRRDNPDRDAMEFTDLQGDVLATAGKLPPIRFPGEGTFRTTIGDRIGNVFAYTYASTNKVSESAMGRVTQFEAGGSFYVPWDWTSRKRSSGQVWMASQIWTMKLFAVDSVHYLVGFGFPVLATRSHRYRYVLMEVGRGEVATTSEVDEPLFYGDRGNVYGARELEDGTAMLSVYRLAVDTT